MLHVMRAQVKYVPNSCMHTLFVVQRERIVHRRARVNIGDCPPAIRCTRFRMRGNAHVRAQEIPAQQPEL